MRIQRFEKATQYSRVMLTVAALCLGVSACQEVPLSDIGPELSDSAPLSDSVRAALDASPETRLQRIRVKTVEGGLVRLSGTVDTEALRDRAERIAMSVTGVRSVINTLQVN